MNKIKAKIKCKTIRMQTLKKPPPKPHTMKTNGENMDNNSVVKVMTMNKVNIEKRRQMVKERYQPAQFKKAGILKKNKKGAKTRRNSFDDVSLTRNRGRFSTLNSSRRNRLPADEKTTARLAILSS
jgi:hypothetical protein